MRNVTPTSAPKGLSHAAEFWSVLILPWVLDIAGGRGLLTSLFGALLWGLAVVLAAVRPRTLDPRFRARQGQALLVIGALWMGYWGFSFFEAPPPMTLAPESVRLLTLLHAGLLTAGFGMVCLLGSASCLWLLQESVLRKSSWERRQWKGRLPSLEAVATLCRRAVQLAFGSWGLGLLLAIFTAVMRWPNHDGAPRWWLDTRVLVTALLWLALAGGFQISVRARDEGRWLYRTYLALAFFFTLGFAWFMIASNRSTFLHEKLNWFI